MMANNWQRLNIWLKLKDRYDYNEYSQACIDAGCYPQSALEFAQKAGMVSCAMAAFPELPVAEAYLTFIKENQEAFTPPASQSSVTPTGQTQTHHKGNSAGVLPPGYKREKVTITFADGRSEEQEIVMPDGTQKQGCCGGGQIK